MIGIYKATNLLNDKVYIGQSINIKKRISQHKHSSLNSSYNDYGVRFHDAIRKHGFENFKWEVIVEISPEEYSVDLLNKLEKYYIEKYDSYNFEKGYNATLGGEDYFGNKQHFHEKNGRAKLIEQDVYRIRHDYNNHIPFREVFEQYQDRISKRGLQKIWYFETWKDICPEFNTAENKYWHSHNAKANSSEVASNNTRSFSKEEVIKMRQLYHEGKTVNDIYKKYYPTKAYSTVRNMLVGKTYRDIK